MAGRLQRLGLRLRPLFNPDHERHEQRLRAIQDAVELQHRVASRERETVEALTADIRRLEERLAKVSRETESVLGLQRETIEHWRDESVTTHLKTLKAVEDAVRGMRATLQRQGSFTTGLMKRARRLPESLIREHGVRERLRRVAAGSRPIIVGPWTGEVGFELIYWIPFVRWFVRAHGIDPARLIVVSRGGTREWYGDLGAGYLELFDLIEPETFQAASAEGLKQRTVRPLDVRVARAIVRARGGRCRILHPQYMWSLFKAFFNAEGGIRHVFDHTVHERIGGGETPRIPGLPSDYVAVKFYFRPSFRDTPDNRAFVARTLEQLASRTPVVLLNSGLRLDDHHDYGDRRYYELADLGVEITPQNNLAIQTAVVRGARAFVGTYGGFSYLAPLCGVPSIAFYDEYEFYLHHRYMADAVFASIGAPALTMLPVDASDLQRHAVLELVRRREADR